MSSGTNTAMLRAVERAMQDLPPLPAVVTRVMQVTGDDHGSAAEIERLVKSDQAIASKLLRVVNSPYYGLAGRVGNLSQAVVILGFHQVRNIVASLGALSLFESKPATVQRALGRHWLHAFGAAVCAQIVGRHKRLPPHDQELAFVLGLLANVGQLFLVAEFGPQYQQIVRQSAKTERPLTEVETSAFGLDHPSVGRLLLDRWNLPPEIRAPVSAHEGPFDESTAPLTLLTHLADRVSWQVTEDHDEFAPTLSNEPTAWRWLAFSDEEKQWLARELGVRLQSAAELICPAPRAA